MACARRAQKMELDVVADQCPIIIFENADSAEHARLCMSPRMWARMGSALLSICTTMLFFSGHGVHSHDDILKGFDDFQVPEGDHPRGTTLREAL